MRPVKVDGVCSNCGQYVRGGDCLNECRRRGFAAAPAPLVPCPAFGQPQPACITLGPAPYFVTGIRHVCGREGGQS